MLHDNKENDFYDNAIVKVYNIPVFYLPKLSHPDPMWKKIWVFTSILFDSKNLGSGVTVPYFWALNDKNSFTNKFYVTENPLFLGSITKRLKVQIF